MTRTTARPIAALAPIALVAFALAGTARADAVPGPPRDCPAGAIGETGHNGPYCAPLPCTSDADCKSASGFDERPRACKELPICVVERKEGSQSGWSHGTPITLRVAGAPCASDGACAAGTCERGKHCVLVEAPTPPPATAPAPTSSAPTASPSKGCGCSVADPSAPLWLLALAVLKRRRTAKV